MSEWFVTEKEKDTFHPNDWNMPVPWISSFIFTHIKSEFWGYGNDQEWDYKHRPKVLQIGCAQGWDAIENAKILKLPSINGELHIIDWFKGNLTVDTEEEWYYSGSKLAVFGCVTSLLSYNISNLIMKNI